MSSTPFIQPTFLPSDLSTIGGMLYSLNEEELRSIYGKSKAAGNIASKLSPSDLQILKQRLVNESGISLEQNNYIAESAFKEGKMRGAMINQIAFDSAPNAYEKSIMESIPVMEPTPWYKKYATPIGIVIGIAAVVTAVKFYKKFKKESA